MEQPAGPESSGDAWMVHPRDAWMGLQLHGGHRPYSYGAGISVRSPQISPRTNLDRWSLSVVDDSWHGVHWSSLALRSGRLLGIRNRSLDRQPGSHHRSFCREANAWWPDHRRRNSLAVFCFARIRDSRTADWVRLPSCLDGVEAWHQRMANAGTHRKTSDL